MPLTASINRHPETENQSETAAVEMKGTLDLAIGNAVSVKATFRATPAGLIGGSNAGSRYTRCRPFRSQRRF